jgi:hypothetical protein
LKWEKRLLSEANGEDATIAFHALENCTFTLYQNPREDEKMRCKFCNKKVACSEHGEHYIEEIMESGIPVYYCSKCVEEYKTAFGAIVHDHLADVLGQEVHVIRGKHGTVVVV